MTAPINLFRDKRVCVACRCVATRNYGSTVPDEPRIGSIIPYLFLRKRGKGRLRSSRSVTICDKCLETVLHGGFEESDDKAQMLLCALLESIRATYNKVLDEEAA